MSELSDDLAAALDRDKWPGVVVYDPETGACEDPGPRGSGRVFLPEIDDLEETESE